MRNTRAMYVVASLALICAALAACTPVSVPGSDNTPAPAAQPAAQPAALAGELGAPAPLVVSNLELVAQLTGEESINRTLTRFGIAGTDLGHMFDMGGRLYMVFGDTFGCCIPGTGGPGGAKDWRSNTMAVIDDQDPADGLTFAGMVTDEEAHAAQIIRPGRDDVTVIPTNGIAVGGSMYLHYMAVRRWGDPGEWDLNASGFAYSDDKGETWTKDSASGAALWPGDSNFGQVALVREGGFVYLFGIPGGRFGGVQLARVPEDALLDASAYHYLSGAAQDGPAWSEAPDDAATIVPAPVGELSVLWNEHLGRWIMTYLNEDKAALAVRSAAELWGPWSDESILVSGREYPQLYGAYLHPWLTENGGETVYFTMSLWQPYNVFLMRARLALAE